MRLMRFMCSIENFTKKTLTKRQIDCSEKSGNLDVTLHLYCFETTPDTNTVTFQQKSYIDFFYVQSGYSFAVNIYVKIFLRKVNYDRLLVRITRVAKAKLD